jgi:hypothetical protein
VGAVNGIKVRVISEFIVMSAGKKEREIKRNSWHKNKLNHSN